MGGGKKRRKKGLRTSDQAWRDKRRDRKEDKGTKE